MRPRKTLFGTMKFEDFKKFALDNNIHGHTVHIEKDVLTYTFLVMFRNNKRPPEELQIDVSTVSKNILHIRSDQRKFLNIDDVIDKLRKP